jgi:hypothetical protein
MLHFLLLYALRKLALTPATGEIDDIAYLYLGIYLPTREPVSMRLIDIGKATDDLLEEVMVKITLHQNYEFKHSLDDAKNYATLSA